MHLFIWLKLLFFCVFISFNLTGDILFRGRGFCKARFDMKYLVKGDIFKPLQQIKRH